MSPPGTLFQHSPQKEHKSLTIEAVSDIYGTRYILHHFAHIGSFYQEIYYLLSQNSFHFHDLYTFVKIFCRSDLGMKSDFLQLGFSVECTGWTDNMLSMKSKIGVLPSTKYLIKIPDNTQLNRMPIPKAEADPDPNRFITFGYTRSVLDPKLKTPSRQPLQCRACMEPTNCVVSKKHMQQTWASQAKDILHVVSALYLRMCWNQKPFCDVTIEAMNWRKHM